ncbi:folylpolyglutamate synthase/dihydrofolate synthase family protein [Auritidibacter sp. NML100628]|uniref:bifunctional folylpolyglutamate synthase/dihydrofolate synthase n=1 Tax=Auritidibacter sp. NML100628 TaxID=2170742 RepID=UPI001F211153|nr:folylpolyglutamate synthase/dihydrofolate synthase family protein [Auritidibacter sp. NML100628]
MSELSPDPQTGPQSLEELYGDLLARAPENKMEPRMEPMYRAMELLGDPQHCAPVIHLTGTNGKTSTAGMIETMLNSYGLSTGRYTSPHLVKFTERIKLNSEPVDDETVLRVWSEILPVVRLVDQELLVEDETPLTYFEAMTVLAFAIFADAPVDVMVLEVGLGGITDATNVADAQVSVITPISLDHTDLLGETVEEIAEEKAGIIKPDGYVVSAAQEPAAAQVLLDKAREVGASFAFENLEFGVTDRRVAVGGQQVSVQGLSGTYPELFLPLHGPHQAENLAVAIATMEAFLGHGGHTLNQQLLQQGLLQVTSPGRLEVLRTNPTLVIDAAHNPAGMEATAVSVTEAFNFTKLALVVGILEEKDARGVLTSLYDAFGDTVEHVALTASASPRAIDPDTLVEYALDAGWDADTLHPEPAPTDAIRWAVEAVVDEDEELHESGTANITDGTGGPGVLVTGSITLVGQVRGLLGPGETETTDTAAAHAAAAAAVVEDHDDLAAFFATEEDDTDDDVDRGGHGQQGDTDD